jgi:UDP-2,3-diacylglucosamine pyrophosphatase LpxH
LQYRDNQEIPVTPLINNSDDLDTSYNRKVSDALDQALARIKLDGYRDLELATERYVILSDQHKGARNGADDFQSAEPIYNAALDHYFAEGYTLIGLGDCEELWEERPEAVIAAYPEPFDRTRQFHAQGRYHRIWGNHDDEWRNQSAVDHHLDPVYQDPQFAVPEGLLFRILENGNALGTLFLVHGHQGTLDSDTFSWFSRIIVRYIWRPIQRLTNWRTNTPATSWDLRKKHNIAMYAWSAQQNKTILIAGHTHRPVFEARTETSVIACELAALKQKPLTPESTEQIAELETELAWEEQRETQFESGFTPDLKPSYFNSGCCVYKDVSLTGIEIEGSEIRLVRWDGVAAPQHKVLAQVKLSTIFAEL